jgi:hypothetical protein
MQVPMAFPTPSLQYYPNDLEVTNKKQSEVRRKDRFFSCFWPVSRPLKFTWRITIGAIATTVPPIACDLHRLIAIYLASLLVNPPIAGRI